MLQGIKLNETLRHQFTGTKHFGILTNLKQLNTFVGANNSGKSRLLRNIFSQEKNIKYIFEIEESQWKRIIQYGSGFSNSLRNLRNYGLEYKLENKVNQIIEKIKSKNDVLINTLEFYDLYSSLEERQFEMVKHTHHHRLQTFLNSSKSASNSLGTIIDRLGIENSQINKTYIPILRGLRPISTDEKNFSNEDIYLKRTKHDYFKQNVTKGEIFTGLSIYERVKRLLLGDENERGEIKDFENFLAVNVFKKKVNLIPKYDDDVLHIKIGDKPQFPIYKLGDGLQTLIIILFPIFIKRKDENLIFIEEPETHLHPKWQRLLYRAMCKFENQTYFISTHSSVFINSTNNSIFIISQQKKSTNIHFSDIKTEKIGILKELGYKPNDLFQTNFLIWVEGQSDKIYLNHFIKSLDETLIEGEDYSIMFYGGSSYKHFLENKGDLNLEFIESLNQNYAIIMDSDRTKSGQKYNPKKKKIKELFQTNNAFCWLTKSREIENYIPFKAFKEAVKRVHKINDIEIEDSQFADRCKYIDLKAKPSYKPRIKLSNKLFSQIQKNKNGTLKGITAKELRKEIETSIESTKRTVNNIDKVKVAEDLVGNNVQMENEELKKKIQQLVDDIKKANS